MEPFPLNGEGRQRQFRAFVRKAMALPDLALGIASDPAETLEHDAKKPARVFG